MLGNGSVISIAGTMSSLVFNCMTLEFAAARNNFKLMKMILKGTNIRDQLLSQIMPHKAL